MKKILMMVAAAALGCALVGCKKDKDDKNNKTGIDLAKAMDQKTIVLTATEGILIAKETKGADLAKGESLTLKVGALDAATNNLPLSTAEVASGKFLSVDGAAPNPNNKVTLSGAKAVGTQPNLTLKLGKLIYGTAGDNTDPGVLNPTGVKDRTITLSSIKSTDDKNWTASFTADPGASGTVKIVIN